METANAKRTLHTRRNHWIGGMVALVLAGLFLLSASDGRAQQIGSTLTPTLGVITLPPVVTIAPTITPTFTAIPGATFTFVPFITQTSPPVITIDPRIVPTARTCSTPLRLVPGDTVALTPGVNLRNLPTTSGAVVNYYTSEVVLTIVEGPVCADGYNWFRVAGAGEPGWVIEGSPAQYFLRVIAVVDPDQVCFPPLDLPIGTRALTVAGVLVHGEPDLDSLVLSSIPVNTIVTITAGPICADNLNFFALQLPIGAGGALVTVWAAEGYPDAYLFQRETPATVLARCYRALRLSPGSRIASIYGDGIPRRLRAAPSLSAAIVQEVIAGVAFEITGAPVCADSNNFFPVRLVAAPNITGWLAEGRPGDYFFDIIYEAPRIVPTDRATFGITPIFPPTATLTPTVNFPTLSLPTPLGN